MPYKNDVFISYKRGKISEEWLQDVFYPFFYDELNNALPFEPKIFVDKTGLTPGVDFSNELFSNLIFSKCLVSIWSPPYFRRSEWCLKEFLTMRYKQEYYQLSALTMPKTLVWPIMYRTVQPLPVAVKSISYLDYSDYNFVGPVKQSPLIIDLQKKLKADIASLVNIILHAPAYNEYWDTPEGSNKLISGLKDYLEQNDNFDNPFQNPITWPKE